MNKKNLIIGHDDLILITGSNGFIGSSVVEGLLRAGFSNLRCFVRPSSNLTKRKQFLPSHKRPGRGDAGKSALS